MATTGLLAFGFAKATTDEYGKIPEYEKGFFIDYPIQADVAINYGNTPFYGGNRKINNDTDFTDGTITIGVPELGKSTKEAYTNEKYILGGALDEESSESPTLYRGAAVNSPYGGSGYVKTIKYPDSTNTEYELMWYYRTRYTPTGDSASTKAGSTTWASRSISGEIEKVPGVDENKNLYYSKRFTTEKEAIDALKTLVKCDEAAASQTSEQATE